MEKILMASVAAAALFAATGFAAAQGQGGAKGSESPAAASPKGESGSMGGSMSREPSGSQARDSDSKSGSGRAEDKSRPSTGPQQAQDKAGGSTDTKSSTKTSDSPSSGSAKSGSSTADTKSGSKTDSSTADTKSGSTGAQTTGNAATSATAAPPAEKRTQITSVIKEEKIQETTNVNFNISVGATVPASVHFYPLPSRVVEIYPEWRGYQVILVHGRYVIVRPQTHEIVYIIEG